MIKTKLQVSKNVEYQKYKMGSLSIPDGGVINCAKSIYKAEGNLGFWRGFSACSSRAIIANSFMFMSYEFAQKKYSEKFE